MSKTFEIIELVPKDVHLIIDIPLVTLVNLNKAADFLITKEEKTPEDTEIINCLENFLKDVRETIKELDQNEPHSEPIIKRS